MRILLLFSLIIAYSCSPVQKNYSSFEFKAVAPKDTSLQEKVPFEVRFELSYPGKNAPEHEFIPPDFNKLKIIIGPTKGNFSSTNILNGEQTTTSGISYSYWLMAENKGKYTIPNARIRTSNKTYKSGSITVQIASPETKNDTAPIIFKVLVPESVEVDQPFRISFEINSADGKDLQAPSFEGIEILAGPMMSTSMTSILNNGKRETTKKSNYGFTLRTKKGGTLTISPARIAINGKEYQTEEIKIQVKGNVQASEL